MGEDAGRASAVAVPDGWRGRRMAAVALAATIALPLRAQTDAGAFEDLDRHLRLSDETTSLGACLAQQGAFETPLQTHLERISTSPAFESLLEDGLVLLRNHAWSDSSAESAARLVDPQLRAAGILMTLSQFARSAAGPQSDDASPRLAASAIHLAALAQATDGRCVASPSLLTLIHTLSETP